LFSSLGFAGYKTFESVFFSAATLVLGAFFGITFLAGFLTTFFSTFLT
jgi:hypothetical protein